MDKSVKKNNLISIISLVLGIVSLILLFVNIRFSFIFAVIGIILSILSRRKGEQVELATAGLIVSLISIVLVIVFIILMLIIFDSIGAIFGNLFI